MAVSSFEFAEFAAISELMEIFSGDVGVSTRCGEVDGECISTPSAQRFDERKSFVKQGLLAPSSGF